MGHKDLKQKNNNIYKGEDFVMAVLNRCLCCRLGLMNKKSTYIVPMTFTFDGYNLYMHWQDEIQNSKKMEFIDYHINNEIDVCVELDVVGPFVPSREEVEGIGCYWDIAYSSVIGYGKISKVTDECEKRKALEERLKRFTGREWEIPEKMFNVVAVWKVSLKKDKTEAKYYNLNFPSKENDIYE